MHSLLIDVSKSKTWIYSTKIPDMSQNGMIPLNEFYSNSPSIYGDIIQSQMTIEQNYLMNIETQLWDFSYWSLALYAQKMINFV